MNGNGKGSPAVHSKASDEVAARVKAEQDKQIAAQVKAEQTKLAAAQAKAEKDKLEAELQSWSRVKWPWLAGCIAVVLVYLWAFDFLGLIFNLDKQQPAYWLVLAVSTVVIGSLLYAFYRSLARAGLESRIKLQNVLLTATDITKLQEELSGDFFTTMVRINNRFLAEYYAQTQTHADRSFSITRAVCIAGFAIIAVGVAMVFAKQAQAATVTVIAGVVSEFIGSIFFYLYNRTIAKMSEYHRKLVLTQNLSVALKIAEVLPVPDRAKAQQELITQLTLDLNKHLMSEEPDGREWKPFQREPEKAATA